MGIVLWCEYCVVVWVLCCGVGIVLWCEYCVVPFESFVLRHLVIATSATPRNHYEDDQLRELSECHTGKDRTIRFQFLSGHLIFGYPFYLRPKMNQPRSHLGKITSVPLQKGRGALHF